MNSILPKSPFRLSSLTINIICTLLAITGFSINAVAYYPGLLSPDNIDQYSQALHNSYHDWHPPVMAGTWHLLLNFYNGPQPMFFIQLLLLWGSFFLLMRLFVSRYFYLSFLVLVLYTAPFVHNFSGTVWKDIHLATSWLFVCGMMINAWYQRRSFSYSEAILSLLLLFYGYAVRTSGLAGLFPLLILWFTLFPGQRQTATRSRLFLKTLVLTTCLILTQTFVTSYVLNAKKKYIEYKLFLHDLTGIYHSTGENCYPDFIKAAPGFDSTYLRTHYDCATFDNIWWNGDTIGPVMRVVSESQFKITRSHWLEAVSRHPMIYLRNRTTGFFYFLRIKDSPRPLATFFHWMQPNDYGFTFTPNKISIFFMERNLKNQNALYMQPWFWLILNVLGFAVAFFKRVSFIKPLLVSLSLSSMLYIAFEFIVFPADTEFRYFYWNCLSVSVCLLLAIAEIIKPTLETNTKFQLKTIL